MKGIKLVRVDFRLIHGQVITKWSNTINTKQIIIVNDELSKDDFMADIYIMAAPPGIDVKVFSKADFVTEANKGSYNSGSILVLFKNIKDVADVAEKKIKFKQVQIGGLGSGTNKKSVVKGISIDIEDANYLKKIQDNGTEVTFQVTPEETKISLDKALKKLGV